MSFDQTLARRVLSCIRKGTRGSTQDEEPTMPWLPTSGRQDWLLALGPVLRKTLWHCQRNRSRVLLLMYSSLQRALALQTQGFFWKEHIQPLRGKQGSMAEVQ